MAKKLSKTGIQLNQPVLPFQVSQSVDAFTGADDYDISISGSLTVTGSITGTPLIENNLTASYATNALTASYAFSASVEILKEISSSHADTASLAINALNSSTASYIAAANVEQPFDSLIVNDFINVDGKISASGDITASAFKGSGNGLTNIPSSAIIGLNLSQITSGTATASISETEGFRVNRSSEITGSLIVDLR